MAELASAVSTLLGVISHEAQRLGRVRHDVQFIQEEVESMSSFLADLSRMSRQHDEQVHTWMNQVRILANDCNSCIDLYLYRGDPAHLPKEGPSRYLRWAPWLLRKLLAQHRAADQLRELKDRAQDIGNRRMRYGVEVKKESSAYGAGLTEALLLSATQENEEDDYQHGGDPLKVALSMTSMWMDKEDYVRRKLEDWIGPVVWWEAGAEAANKGIKLTAVGSTEPVARSKPLLPSIAIVVKTDEDADHLRRIVLTVAEDHFKRKKDVQHKAAMPPETKDASSALAHKDKAAVPTETMDAAGTLAHKDMADVPPETKEAGGPLVMKDKAAVPAEIKDASGALTHIDKADVPAKTKDAGNALVFVDVPAVHYNNVPLQPHKLLCYILAELERLQGGASTCRTRWGTYKYTRNTIREIKVKIKEVGIDGKINGIIIRNLMGSKGQLSDLQILDKLEDENDSIKEIGDEALGQLLRLLIYHSTSAAASEKDKKIKSGVAELYNVIIKQTAKELKRIMEAGGSSSKLQEPEYEDTLKTVFPEPTSSSATTVANSPHSTLADDQIQEMAEGVTEMMHDLQELDKSAKTTVEADFHDTTEKKKEEIIKKIRKQLKVKMMVQKIRKRLEGDQRILVILKVDDKYPPQWEETRNSLSLLELDCPIAGAVFVVTKTTQRDYPCPDLMDRIEYSLVDLYFHTVLQKTGHHMNDEEIRKILHNILCECKSDELCMKIFAHALYAKPKRSREELSKFHSILCTDAAKKSLPSLMLNFSCGELPKEYMSCLLYLTIFPQGQTIRRSTLIGRWVAERLITTRDWRWSDSVDEAEKCFDTLVARRLVCPARIGATGKVKSCTVDKLVYGFTAKIAVKQHILDTQLSLHLARHFSIFSDVRLGRYATIKDFLRKSSQFSRLKVLDLEGCECFPAYQHYLSDLCSKILMLKYLSLRGTGVTRLPSEINNLHELEVLDIRETYIPASATRNVLLRKLKRLLAGQKLKDLMAQSQSSPADKIEKVEVLRNGKLQNVLRRLSPSHVDSSPADYFSVQIPEKIEKMLGVEVLSNVKPKSHQDLKDIGGLNELNKLGVVINKESDLTPLLNTISDLLNQSLRFLSITLDITIYKYPAVERSLQNIHMDLESLTINGSKKFPKDIKSTSTQMGRLLKSLTENGKQLAKVTLSCTFLSQEDLKLLADLANLRSVKLRHNAYTESKLIFNKDEFKNLNNFLVEGNNMAEITFDNGAASNLEKIVLSSTNIVSISGVDYLQKLEEFELKRINKPLLHSLLDNAKHIAKVTLHDTLLEQGDLEILARDRNMRYLALFGRCCNSNRLILKECDFHKLNVLIVDSDDITEISFTDGSPNLEKIVWSFKEIVSLSGIDKLPALKEVQLNGYSVPNKVEEDIKKLKSGLDYKQGNRPRDQAEKTREPDGPARRPSLWKVKDWCWRN